MMRPSRMLLPFVLPYGIAVAVRNWLYQRGILSVYRARVPVISVGNITAGGTGKTPFIEYLIRLLGAENKHLAVLSRGYGRRRGGQAVVRAQEHGRGSAAFLGDELRQIAMKFPSVSIIANPDRASAARHAVEELGAEMLLLDDGFQHRALYRDLDIVLIDATQPLRKQFLLPAGYRREPVASLGRAGLLAYTRVDGTLHPEMKELMRTNPGVHVKFVPVRWRSLDSQKGFALETLRLKPAVVFCGIGNPDQFIGTVSSLGVDIREAVRFPDHHWYTPAEIGNLVQMTHRHKAVLITTEKDAARLDDIPEPALRDALYALEIQADITGGEELLREKLSNVLEYAAR